MLVTVHTALQVVGGEGLRRVWDCRACPGRPHPGVSNKPPQSLPSQAASPWPSDPGPLMHVMSTSFLPDQQNAVGIGLLQSCDEATENTHQSLMGQCAMALPKTILELYVLIRRIIHLYGA